MKLGAAILALCITATLLAGCGSKASGGNEIVTTQAPLAEGKGAISGLVIDDRYRPVANALVLLTPLGLTVTTDGEGQFSFADLEPGAYILLAQAKDHEAAPKNVDVTEGQYAEAELTARRVFSDTGYLITTQYSIFIGCAIDYIANGQDGLVLGQDCVPDESGDTFRPDFTSDYTKHGKNATYIVAEMLANKEDWYEIQLRGSCGQLATDDIHGIYSRIQLNYGNASTQSNTAYGPNAKWTNKCPIQTILFADEGERTTLQALPVVGGAICCGAGVHLGIKGQFVQSLFLGEPLVNINDYGVLRPK